LDVADAEAVQASARTIAQRWGGIDLWVNNAMVTMFAPLWRMSPQEFRRITEVTYLGYVHGTMAALDVMRPAGAGVILQVGSALSYRAIPLQSAYCGAKAAIRAFTDALRSELLHEGGAIRLSMLQLPAINTPQFDWARNIFPRRPQPLPPVFEPEAIAEIILRAWRDPPRELWIGLPTLKLIAGAMAAPALMDRYLAGAAYRGQLSSEPEHPGRPDNLVAPTVDGYAVRGRFSNQAHARVAAFDPTWLRAVAAAGVSALLLAALSPWLSRAPPSRPRSVR